MTKIHYFIFLLHLGLEILQKHVCFFLPSSPGPGGERCKRANPRLYSGNRIRSFKMEGEEKEVFRKTPNKRRKPQKDLFLK